MLPVADLVKRSDPEGQPSREAPLVGFIMATMRRWPRQRIRTRLPLPKQHGEVQLGSARCFSWWSVLWTMEHHHCMEQLFCFVVWMPPHEGVKGSATLAVADGR